MDDLPVFEPIKAVGKCGACGKELYPHSSPGICDYRQDCPMHGERWQAYQQMLAMRNTRIDKYEDFKPSDRSWMA